MSNLAGKAYALTVISPQWATWINRYIYAVIRCLPDVLGLLHNMQIIHFARWVLLPADRWPAGEGWRSRHGYLLFASNFNSTWDVYLDEFSDILALGLDLFWYRGWGFKKSVPSTPFKAYIDHNSFDAGYFYNATPCHSARDVNHALIVRTSIEHLQQYLLRLDADTSLNEAEREWRFEQEFNLVLRNIQNLLPTPGPAPLAGAEMVTLKRQHRERIRFLEQRWPAPDQRTAPDPAKEGHAEF
ncbi:MAG: hypothetical protein ACKO0M_08085 [Cyanobium sp.]